MKIDRRTLLFAGAGAVGAMASGRAWADAPVTVRGVVVEPHGVSARVTLALDAPAAPRTFFLREPDRFVIDLPNAQLATPVRVMAGGGVVRRCRLAQQRE